MAVTKQQALDYHEGARPGKIEVSPTKPCRTQRDLSLAYTPGVAEPCLEIHKNAGDAFKYTSRGNLVAVVSNGTAVLGIGDIGALAGKPEIISRGFVFVRDAEEMFAAAQAQITTAVARVNSNGSARRHWGARGQAGDGREGRSV